MNPPSVKLRQAAAMFALSITPTGRWSRRVEPPIRRWAAAAADVLLAALAPGQIALVTGPSGGGKSTLLRAVVRRLGRRVVRARTAYSSRRVVDLLDLPLDQTLGTLSRAGLADARLLARPGRTLSEGERFRLALALAMTRAGRTPALPLPGGVVLVVDEFASVLDRVTAASVARALRRWVRPPGPMRVIVATAHDDVLEALAPDVLVEAPLAQPPRVYTR